VQGRLDSACLRFVLFADRHPSYSADYELRQRYIVRQRPKIFVPSCQGPDGVGVVAVWRLEELLHYGISFGEERISMGRP
jgi:hypothetical protein